MAKNKRHELVIIGAGPGGYKAAFAASDLNMEVTIIDPEENPGGVCLYRGCIPSKALLHLAKVKNDAIKAEAWGLKFSEPEINLKKIASWKASVVQKLTGGLGQLTKKRKINYIRGKAVFTGKNNLEITKNDGSKDNVDFEKAIIATGAKPVKIPSINYDSKFVMTSAEALELKDVPKKLLVVGGSYIGLEMGSIYQALGSEVSVVELTPDLLPGVDKDLVRIYKKEAKNTFKEFRYQSQVTNIKENKNSVRVTIKNKDNQEESITYDKLLMATGHKPNSEGIGLEEAGIETDEKGFISTNNKQQTNQNHIYAIGDVVGGPLLAHKASYEGRVAAEAIAGKNAKNDAKAIPAVIYTDPEIATCGMKESEAKEKEISYKVLKFPWSASGRSVAMGESSGLTKLIVNQDTERVIGAAVVGKHAGDLISELVLAVEMAALASDVALTIHPHPTLSETIMEAAESFYGYFTHFMGKK